MLTFRRFTTLFFFCLLALNLISIFFCDETGGLICSHMAAMYFWIIGLYLGISVLMASYPQSGFHHPAWSKGKGIKQTVALTFDDGPDPDHTPRILEILRRQRAPATFFCTGKQAEGNPLLLKQAVSEGHLLGNHSWSHSRWFDFYPPRRIRLEIARTNELIASVTGKTPALFRPPFGVVNPMVSKALRATGMNAVAWNIRSLDTVRTDHPRTLKRILRKLTPGSIILLHDHSAFTSQYLEKLITGIRNLNYEIVPLDELLELNAYE